MMKGSGIDILRSARFDSLVDRTGFLENVFTPREISRSSNSISTKIFFAALFTLKESILKALGCGLHHGSFWQGIEIENDLSLKISHPVSELAAGPPVRKIHVSVACTKDYALSIALAEA